MAKSLYTASPALTQFRFYYFNPAALLSFWPSDTDSAVYQLRVSLKMVSTEDLRAEKLFSVKGFVCVVTGGGTGIGLM
jgi:hypothetical protein